MIVFLMSFGLGLIVISAMALLVIILSNHNIRKKYADLINNEEQKPNNIKSLVARKKKRNKILTVTIIPLFILGLEFTFYSTYLLEMELVSNFCVDVSYITLSEQEERKIAISQTYSNGKKRAVPLDKVIWTSSNESVAAICDGIIKGMGQGSAVITGTYYNKRFDVTVTVGALDLDADISLKYDISYKTEIFAGNGINDVFDGSLKQASFSKPTSIAITKDGTIYVVDKLIREIKDGKVTTICSGHLVPKTIRTYDNNVYFTSTEWLNDEEQYFISVCQLVEGNVKELIQIPSLNQEITDFQIDSRGDFYVIMTNNLNGTSDLIKICMEDNEIVTLIQGEDQFSGLVIDKDDQIYISQAKNSVIYLFKDNKLEYFAGAKYEKDLVDGKLCKLYGPMCMTTDGDNIYFVDSNVIRKLVIDDGELIDSNTISGVIEVDSNNIVLEGNSVEVTYASGLEMDLLYADDAIYVTDPNANIIRRITRVD